MTPNVTLYQFQYTKNGELLREAFPAEKTDTFMGSFYTIKPYYPEQPSAPLRIASTRLDGPGWLFYNEQERVYTWETESLDAHDLRVLTLKDDPEAAEGILRAALLNLKSRLDAKSAKIGALLDTIEQRTDLHPDDSDP